MQMDVQVQRLDKPAWGDSCATLTDNQQKLVP